MRAVDRDSTEPLWAQVLEDLRARLTAGEFAERFPTDLEITQSYDVSRHTAREAVRHLHDEGLVERTRGRGTFVRTTTIDQPLGAIYSLFRSIEDQGHEQRSRVRTLELRHDPEASTILGVGPDDPLVFLERVRLLDGEPFAVDCSWLPASFAAPLLELDFTRTSLYEELAVRCGVGPDNGWERIAPELPTETQRGLLLLDAAEPVFAIERLALDGDRPIEWRHSVVRGDRFAFVARWAGGDVATAMETRD
ncbi:MAG: GntR family transcriptional regulator [Actinomycetota bacterium]|nr:GntR family transcriptional regulator [Actinomycetota bacterium]